MTLVIDASVAVKWLFAEDGSKSAAAYLATPLIAPPMFRLECANAVIKRLRLREIGRREAAYLLREVEYLPVELRDVSERAVFDLALQLAHPVADCAYLALARAEGIQMLTADDRFVRAARSASLDKHIRLLDPDHPLLCSGRTSSAPAFSAAMP